MLRYINFLASSKSLKCVVAVSNRRCPTEITKKISCHQRLYSKDCKCKGTGKVTVTGCPGAGCPDQRAPECCQDEDHLKYQMRGKDRLEVWPKENDPPQPWRCDCPQGPQPVNYDPYRIKTPDIAVPPLPQTEVKPMLVCAKQRGPCGPVRGDPLPPCPTPPPRPFPWIIPIVIGSIMTFFGFVYKYYLWRDEQERANKLLVEWRPRKELKKPQYPQDLPPCVQYLIIGAGAAGWAGYRAIVEHDPKAKVFFINKEDSLPYMRPPMSKEMWWNNEPPDLDHLYYINPQTKKRESMYYVQCDHFTDPVKFYRRKTGPVTAMASGWCVVRIDADDHCVYIKTNCGDMPMYYEKCLLAPGSKPKDLMVFKTAPKEVRERVCMLRTIREFEVAYRKVMKSKHVTVIGGGTLGTELTYHIARMHKEWPNIPDDEWVPPQVVHVYKDKGILASVIPEYLGEWAAEKVRCENATMIPNAQVYDAYMTKNDKGETKVELTLSNGKCLQTDYIFLCVGATPRDEMAGVSFLEKDNINGGYVVNTELEARKDLYVAGDAASVYLQWKGARVRMEHYMSAYDQGTLAGTNMTGYWYPDNQECSYWMRLKDDIQMQVIGEVGACMPTIGLYKPCKDDPEGEAHERAMGEYDKPCYKKSSDYRNRYKRGMLFYLRDEIIVGMVFWNVPPMEGRAAIVTEVLRAKPTYKEIGSILDLLGFGELQCVYIEEAKAKAAKDCDVSNVLKWLPTEEVEKLGMLSEYEKPAKVRTDATVFS